MIKTKGDVDFKLVGNMIWKRTSIDSKGQTTLPKKLRKQLNLSGKSTILWISVHRTNKDNVFSVELGVKNEKQEKC